MEENSGRSLDRAGAAAGVASVLLFVAIIMFAPAIPTPKHTIAEIAGKATKDQAGILRGLYLGMLLTGALLVFGSSFVARLRRAEGDGGGWWLVALAGIAGTTVGLSTDMLFVTFVRAVGHGVSGSALWVGNPSGPDGVIIAIPLAVFFLGAGFGARASGILPRWLGWLATVLAVAFSVGAGGIMGDEVDGGILGGFLVLGYAGLLVWTVATSVCLWREPRQARAESREVATA